ncbi:hypothetical protein BJY01DRAFT_242160 [Aspergillus pseudoustus]|uniref:FAD-binding PCMH-type domain-containing protein n=1 Tax=Aspergillus pseudoustus TaxID=1810923 RepID=A0ABR4KZM9_9EURO
MAEQALVNLCGAGLGDILYLPGDAAYTARIASYWSLTAQLQPWAIVQPRNTEEVSKAVKALVDAPGVKFAVRTLVFSIFVWETPTECGLSGGHMSWAGASNIVDGITIDLGLMKGTSYDVETQIASLLPGGTWAEVYPELEKHGRMVAGGREGKVGIGGLLTGGGKTFYTCRVGFTCDQVVNYEVVLADGSIVNANDKTNPDLFRVLKGGGNNFGIESTADIAHALVEFTGNLTAHPDDHILAMWTYIPKTRDPFILMSMMNLDGKEEPHTLSKFLSLPGQKRSTVTSIATKLESFIVPSGKQDTWFSLTFKSDPRIILKAASVFEALISTLKSQIPDENFYFSMVLQPLPTSFGPHSAARGGNMLGLDRIKDDCVLLVWAFEVDTAELNVTVGAPALKGAIDEISAYAASVGGDVGFRYLKLL